MWPVYQSAHTRMLLVTLQAREVEQLSEIRRRTAAEADAEADAKADARADAEAATDTQAQVDAPPAAGQAGVDGALEAANARVLEAVQVLLHTPQLCGAPRVGPHDAPPLLGSGQAGVSCCLWSMCLCWLMGWCCLAGGGGGGVCLQREAEQRCRCLAEVAEAEQRMQAARREGAVRAVSAPPCPH